MAHHAYAALGHLSVIAGLIAVCAAYYGRYRPVLDRVIVALAGMTVVWWLGFVPMLAASERWSARSVWPVVLAVLTPIVAIRCVRALWERRRPPRAPRATTHRAYALLPYLAVCAADVSLVAVAARPVQWPGRVVLFAAVAVTALVVVRQFLTHRGTARLLRDMRDQEQSLRRQVAHDELTGLANRALFRDRLAAALHDDSGATVLLIDLDDFKSVNDSFGHDAGDRLLAAVAATLRAAVDDDGLPARVGADQFAVLLSGPGADGDAVAQRVLHALRRPVGEHELFIQASIGIAAAAPGASLDRVLRDADAAMYAAKERGQGGYHCYTPGMDEPVLTHIKLGGELRRALDEHELRVVYQPVMDLADGRVIGVEALVRWEHPTRGTVAPGEFIPTAERTGLIVPLGRYVLRETCRQAAAWLAEFGPDALQKVGPNVSARQLHDPNFTSDVVRALSDSGLSCDRLVLELTESAVLRGQQVSRTLHELDRMGVKLALDDFGTGESSLSLLRSFPAAIIKLDKSFVDGIEIDDPDPAARDARQAVARAVLQLADAFGLDAVAEGIENAAQVQRLRELGYSLGQGFYLARPMSADDMGRLLAAQASSVPVS